MPGFVLQAAPIPGDLPSMSVRVGFTVSKKVGYTESGWQRTARLGKPATLRRLVLTPDSLVRYEHELTVDGLPEFRQSIGLAAG